MANRINAYSMATPDAYGNMSGSMVTPGTIEPSLELSEKKRKKQQELMLQQADPNYQRGMGAYTMQAQNSLLEKIDNEPTRTKMDSGAAFDATAGALAKGVGDYQAQGGTFTGGNSAANKGAGLAAGTAAAANIGGFFIDKIHVQNKDKNKEIAGGVGKGWAKGSLQGAAAGSVIGPWGTLIGAAIGGTIGAISGGIKTSKARKNRLLMEKETNEYNKRVEEINRKKLGQAADLDRYQQLLQSAGSNTIRYKRGGGLLRYGYLNVTEGLSYINSLKVEKNKNGGTIKTFKFQSGGSLAPANKEEQMFAELVEKVKLGREKGLSNKDIATALKVEEDLINKITTALDEEAKSAPKFKTGGSLRTGQENLTALFRRGGIVDLKKQNVIIDGPSHDEENNTGVAGDKGLPVVVDGKKIAEIESEELVINANSVSYIEKLKERIKKGDVKAKEELGELLYKELHTNTYDYADLMTD